MTTSQVIEQTATETERRSITAASASVNNTAGSHTCENCGSGDLRPFVVPGRANLRYCTRCELYQGGRLPSSAVYEDEYHEGYLSALPRKTWTGVVRLSRIADLVDRQVADARPVELLDIGCSIGATLAAAGELGWDAHGVDVSRSAVDSCVQRGEKASHFDGDTLPFDDQSFDVVTAWHVIEHVEDVTATLREWYRVVRPGGLLVLETPHANCMKARLLGKRYRKFWPAEHLYTFQPSNLAPFVCRAGFEPLPVPDVVWPKGLAMDRAAYALAHQSYLAVTKLTGFCKAFQIVARRPWSSVGESRSAA